MDLARRFGRRAKELHIGLEREITEDTKMGLRDMDLNKDGVTLGDHLDNMKENIENLFDGDSSNSNNVIDRVSRQMRGSVVSSKIDALNQEALEEEKKISEE